MSASKTTAKTSKSTTAKKTAKLTSTDKPVSNIKEVARIESKKDLTKQPPKKPVSNKKQKAKRSTLSVISFDKNITDKLKSIVANYTEHPELLDNIERDTTKSFIENLNIDSVDFVEIIVDVEQAFDISIKDDEIYQLKSFEDLYLAIEGKIKETKKA